MVEDGSKVTRVYPLGVLMTTKGCGRDEGVLTGLWHH
jgi:hypothetical protein